LRQFISLLVSKSAVTGIRTGDWAAVLIELEAALEDDWEPVDRYELLCAMYSIGAFRGEPVDAQFDEASRLVSNTDDPQIASNVVNAAAEAAFASGDLGEARRQWQRAAGQVDGLVPYLAPRAARAALWMGNGAGARDDLAQLDALGVHGPANEADRRTIRAGLAALDGRPAEALPLYREALRAWRDLGLAWDEALCGIDMATLLDPADPEVRSAADSAREIFVRLGAKPFLARLDGAMDRQASAPTPEPARARDPSTV
jgi:tetratricopeptide (TPR) repeat protein